MINIKNYIKIATYISFTLINSLNVLNGQTATLEDVYVTSGQTGVVTILSFSEIEGLITSMGEIGVEGIDITLTSDADVIQFTGASWNSNSPINSTKYILSDNITEDNELVISAYAFNSLYGGCMGIMDEEDCNDSENCEWLNDVCERVTEDVHDILDIHFNVVGDVCDSTSISFTQFNINTEYLDHVASVTAAVQVIPEENCGDEQACNYDACSISDDDCIMQENYCLDLDGDGAGSGNELSYCPDEAPTSWVPDCSDTDEVIDCTSNEFDCQGYCIYTDETISCGANIFECICTGTVSSNLECSSDWSLPGEDDECGICNGDSAICSDCNGVVNGPAYEDNCGNCDDDITNDCVADCTGNWGGIAMEDACGVCEGDNSTCTDCNDIVNGTSFTDECGECVSEGDDSCVQACNGKWYNDDSGPVIDECGICDGDNTTCLDCANEVNGTSFTDECGECVSEGDINCQQGCDGLWVNDGSGLEIDECGVCGGDNSTCADCNGVINGSAYIDPHYNEDSCTENECVGGDTGFSSCDHDCTGAWGGSTVEDACGVCSGTEIDPENCTCGGTDEPDCAGNCPGDVNYGVEEDECGICGGVGTTCLDCFGVVNGMAFVDNCSVCVADGDESCVQACDGVWYNNGSGPETDACGVCDGDNTTCLDCANEVNGTSFTDECGECVSEGDINCQQGCDGLWMNDGSQLVFDDCGVCDGDNTSCSDCLDIPNGGNNEDDCGTCDADPSNDCVADCNGVYGGTAENDECGVCGGDNNSCADCAGVANGTSLVDNCNECVPNDNTSCQQACDGEWYNDTDAPTADACYICDTDLANDCSIHILANDVEVERDAGSMIVPITIDTLLNAEGLIFNFTFDSSFVNLDTTALNGSYSSSNGFAAYSCCTEYITHETFTGELDADCGIDEDATYTDDNDNGVWDGYCKVEVFSDLASYITVNIFLYGYSASDITLGGLPLTIEGRSGETYIELTQFIYNDQDLTHMNSGLRMGINVLSIANSLIPNEFILYQNYPNPFNPVTTFYFDIPMAGIVDMNVYNLNGQFVENVMSSLYTPGSYAYVWNAEDLSSGIYFVEVKVGSQSRYQKVMLLK